LKEVFALGVVIVFRHLLNRRVDERSNAYRMGEEAARDTASMFNPFLKVPERDWDELAVRLRDDYLNEHYSDAKRYLAFDYRSFATGLVAGQQELARNGVIPPAIETRTDRLD
jgi:hypothetical protein